MSENKMTVEEIKEYRSNYSVDLIPVQNRIKDVKADLICNLCDTALALYNGNDRLEGANVVLEKLATDACAENARLSAENKTIKNHWKVDEQRLIELQAEVERLKMFEIEHIETERSRKEFNEALEHTLLRLGGIPQDEKEGGWKMKSKEMEYIDFYPKDSRPFTNEDVKEIVRAAIKEFVEMAEIKDLAYLMDHTESESLSTWVDVVKEALAAFGVEEK